MLATSATALALVLVPRTVDRRWRAQLDQLPPTRDTLTLQAQLAALAERRANAERAEEARVRAVLGDTILSDSLRAVSPLSSASDSARGNQATAGVTPNATPIAAAPVRVVTAADAAANADLARRLRRARTVPLTESYRDLAASPLLRDEPRVRVLLDSIEAVSQERDAFAALGGADARYAALTARLSTLGVRLVRVAETRLAESRVATRATPAPSAPPVPASSATVSSATGASATNTAASDTPVATPAPSPSDSLALVDSTAPSNRDVAHDEFLAAERARTDTLLQWTIELDAARRENDDLVLRRRAIQSRLSVAAPPLALALAALVVGVTIGFALVFSGELRRPTVGDDREVERLTQARVIARRPQKSATRRKAVESLTQLLDEDRTAYELLHLTLTGIGEVARRVHVIADDPTLATVVALNLAATAARDSRVTLLVEDPMARLPMERLPMERVSMDAARGPTPPDAQPSPALARTVTLSRDTSIGVLTAATPQVERLATADRYDLTLMPGDAASIGRATASGLIAPDVLLCVRPGVTSLAWLTAVSRQTRASGQRVRAVLLWTSETPRALSPLASRN